MASGKGVSTTTRVGAEADVAIAASEALSVAAAESPPGAGDERASTTSLEVEQHRRAALLHRGTRLDGRLDVNVDDFDDFDGVVDDVEVSPPLAAPTSCWWYAKTAICSQLICAEILLARCLARSSSSSNRGLPRRGVSQSLARSLVRFDGAEPIRLGRLGQSRVAPRLEPELPSRCFKDGCDCQREAH